MPKTTKSLWRDDLTEEQIQEAKKKLQKWLDKYKAESDEQEKVDDYRDILDELEREEYYESKYGKEQE